MPLALDLGSACYSWCLDLCFFPTTQPIPAYLGWESVCHSGVGLGHGKGRSVHGRVPEQYPYPTPRLAKSTLTLIPLLGTHEVVFAFVMDEHARGTLRFIKLFTELSFTSFQVTSRLGVLTCQVSEWEWGRDQPAPCRWAPYGLGGKWAMPRGLWLEQSQG